MLLLTGYGEQNGKTLELTVAAWVLSAIGVGLLALSSTVTGAAFSFAVWAIGGMLVCPLNDSAALLQLGECTDMHTNTPCHPIGFAYFLLNIEIQVVRQFNVRHCHAYTVNPVCINIVYHSMHFRGMQVRVWEAALVGCRDLGIGQRCSRYHDSTGGV